MYLGIFFIFFKIFCNSLYSQIFVDVVLLSFTWMTQFFSKINSASLVTCWKYIARYTIYKVTNSYMVWQFCHLCRLGTDWNFTLSIDLMTTLMCFATTHQVDFHWFGCSWSFHWYQMFTWTVTYTHQLYLFSTLGLLCFFNILNQNRSIDIVRLRNFLCIKYSVSKRNYSRCVKLVGEILTLLCSDRSRSIPDRRGREHKNNIKSYLKRKEALFSSGVQD